MNDFTGFEMDKMSDRHRPRVAFIGGCHLDRLGFSLEPLVLERSNPGRFREYVGGAALNTARNFRILGGYSHIISIIGNDTAAATIRTELEFRDIGHSLQSGASTANYVALHEPNGSVALAMGDMEIYDRFDAGDALEALERTDLLEGIFLDTNLSADTLEQIVDGTDLPIAATCVSIAKCHRLRPILERVGLLFGNRREMKTLLGVDLFDGEAERAITNKFPHARFVISDGGNSLMFTESGNAKKIIVPEVNNIIDHTGAGDALAAATLYGAICGQPIADAVQDGIALASHLLRVEGPALPEEFSMDNSK